MRSGGARRRTDQHASVFTSVKERGACGPDAAGRSSESRRLDDPPSIVRSASVRRSARTLSSPGAAVTHRVLTQRFAFDDCRWHWYRSKFWLEPKLSMTVTRIVLPSLQNVAVSVSPTATENR